ncbi:HPP family protein [Azohydromonas aeria]|uniref:HPP family protein n=1 Tax=Azohydromonas aeria TaxID=2590212 RepID=UPI001E625427|nr:HPP family protein [Azohydromonas aeria]
MKPFQESLKRLLPPRLDVAPGERLRAAGGGLAGLLATALLARALLDAGQPWLIAPMGASAVLLFALPASPLAQPWPVLGGNLVSAVVGMACAQLLGATPLAAGLALALALLAMFALRCLHPPGGAIALTAVLGGPALQAMGFSFVLAPVGLHTALLLVAAALYNNLTGRAYPHRATPVVPGHQTADAAPNRRLGFTAEDLDAVMRRYGQVLDIDRDDLDSLLRQAEMQAYQRRFGVIRCGDIMSRDLVTVEFGTSLQEAWHLLRRHRVKALPVVDRARRVIGILTLVDFMKHAQLDRHEGWAMKLRDFLRPSGLTHSDKPEAVGQIMTTGVHTASVDTHVVELVPLLSDLGLHHIPIVDQERRLAGMVTQSDLVAALYRGGVDEATGFEKAVA